MRERRLVAKERSRTRGLQDTLGQMGRGFEHFVRRMSDQSWKRVRAHVLLRIEFPGQLFGRFTGVKGQTMTIVSEPTFLGRGEDMVRDEETHEPFKTERASVTLLRNLLDVHSC